MSTFYVENHEPFGSLTKTSRQLVQVKRATK